VLTGAQARRLVREVGPALWDAGPAEVRQALAAPGVGG
jgi:hypothetical protein